MWYIFDKTNRCVSTANFEPDKIDLRSRGEFAVESDQQLAIDQATKDNNGKIIAKPVVQATAEEVRQQKLAALDAKYLPWFKSLSLAWAAASMDENTVLAASIKSDKNDLKVEYDSQRSEIENG